MLGLCQVSGEQFQWYNVLVRLHTRNVRLLLDMDNRKSRVDTVFVHPPERHMNRDAEFLGMVDAKRRYRFGACKEISEIGLQIITFLQTEACRQRQASHRVFVDK